MAYLRGEFSNSFLREPYLTAVSYATDEDGKLLNELLKKDLKGNLIKNKKFISSYLFDMGIDGHILLNAPNLDEIRDYNELKLVLEEIQEFLSDELGLRGVVEIHFGKNEQGDFIDPTVNSSHVHFWGDSRQDSQYVREAFASFLIQKGWSFPKTVFIQKHQRGDKIPDEQKFEAVEEQIRDFVKKEDETYDTSSFVTNKSIIELQSEMDLFEIELDNEKKELKTQLSIIDSFNDNFSDSTNLVVSDYDRQIAELDRQIAELKSFELKEEDLILEVNRI